MSASFRLTVLLVAYLSTSASALRRSTHGEDDQGEEDRWEDDDGVNVTFYTGAIEQLQHTGWCKRSRWIVPSKEDVLAGLKTCSDAHVLANKENPGNACNNPYGKYFQNQAKTSTFYWVEIPKTGSTNVKKAIDKYAAIMDQKYPVAENDTLGVEAFTFVRHPVTRFVSGYHTFLKRTLREAGKKRQKGCTSPELDFLFNEEEPKRFNTFVDLFVRHGSEIARWNRCGTTCIAQHVFSQTWFLNLWPGQVSHFYHTEAFADGMDDLAKMTGLKMSEEHQAETATKKNPKGLARMGRAILLEQRGAIQKLHDYFKEELQLFRYEPLPGYTA